MNIAILHQDLEYQEEVIKQELEKQGLIVDLVDVRETTAEELKKYALILNRVFASVANRNYKDNLTTLKVLSELGDSVPCINSYFTTKCDYSKSYSEKVLINNTVRTPKTMLIDNVEEAYSFAEEVGYPVVLKRDMGGRAKEIFLVDNKEQLNKKFATILDSSNTYKGGYILQEKVKSVYEYDYRVGIINQEITFCNTRSMVADDEGKCWITSASNGSVVKEVEIPKDVEEIALRSTRAIGATMNEADIMIDENGPIIIENNPTPNFTITSPVRRKMLDITIKSIVRELQKNNEGITVESKRETVHESWVNVH